MINFSFLLNIFLFVLCLVFLRKIFQASKLSKEKSLEILSNNNQMKFKSEFIATMAHEIRTPLNGIVIAGTLLAEEDNKVKQHELLDIIKNSSDLLSNVVNDILDFSKINAGKLELDYQPVSLDKCIGDVIFSFANQFQDKGLFLHYKIDPSIKEKIYSDEVRLKQIIYNIIGNAYKFTHSGGVSLNVRREHGEIIFSIHDSGIGLTSKQIESLFTEYTQADKSIQTNYGGTGLGLSITQKLVELLGGSIRVISRYGRGSEFIFSIKDNQIPIDFKSPKETHITDIKEYKCLNILVADDNPMNRKVAELAFHKFDLDIDFANDGNEAVEKALNKSYDIIFMDVQMPNKSGVEASEELIEKIPFSEVPLIFALSASTFKEVKDRCFNAGMSGFLAKPLNLSELNKPLDLALIRKKNKAA